MITIFPNFSRIFKFDIERIPSLVYEAFSESTFRPRCDCSTNLTFGAVSKDSKGKENLQTVVVLSNISFIAYEMGKIISNKNGQYKLPNEFPNDLRL